MTDFKKTPPPLPRSVTAMGKSSMGYGTKLVLIAVIGVLLMVASFVVWGFTSSREATSNVTARDIARAWGERVNVGAIYMEWDSVGTVAPRVYKCRAVVESQRLHRSIYEAQVYEADIDLSGEFVRKPESGGGCGRFVLDVSPSSVSMIQPLLLGDRQYAWKQEQNGFVAYVDGDLGGSFQVRLKVKGSQGLSVEECGDECEISVSGNCGNPSFGAVPVDGDDDIRVLDPSISFPLPNKRDVTKEHFSAMWVSHSSRGDIGVASVQFLLGVDRYQKVERSLKYAFLIILFTFISAFFAERITGCAIPVLNYLLMGLALVLFYVLLLSLCEQMSFGASYSVASVMTVGLISAYMWGMLHSAKVAGVICAILAVMYASCYVLLCLSTYALVMGSLMMFCALAASMYASLKIRM